MARPSPTPLPRTDLSPRPRPSGWDDDPDARFAAWLGERLRRVALGATAALLTARAYWPSEPDLRDDAGNGLVWVFALLVVAGLAVASALAGGTLRLRVSWADAGVVGLAALVALSAGYASERRVAVNLAWEWAGFGVAYLLVRNLPRTRGESVALAGALAATAVAVSAYGLYQVGVELPEVQRRYRANPAEALRVVGITPGSPAQISFENRLLHSNEPYSTFALPGSLAGFLLAPLVVTLALAWEALTRREAPGSRTAALALAVPPLLVVVVCLTLTKSRSAYIGLAVALLALAWRDRKRVRPRTLALAGLAAALLAGVLVVGGLATRRLDRAVLTQTGKSFRYRREYWVGAWRAVNESPRAFWRGFGPGNFVAPYLRHKVPQASEEVTDPHNFVLEVWADAGVWAVGALGVAVVFGLGNLLGPSSRSGAEGTAHDPESRSLTSLRPADDPSAPPAGSGWLVGCAGGGWVAVVLLGRLPLIEGGGLDRWLILGAAWGLALACGLPLWRRQPLPAWALGAGSLALLVNLSAAGGIGFPTVALALWTTVGLGLNLRDDRPCGRLRDAGGRLPAFGVAAVWVAVLGSFVGAVTPYWKAEAAMAEAEDALRGRSPDYDRAEAAYDRAKNLDPFSARPWLAMAALDYELWRSRGMKPEDARWRKVPIEMLKAVSAPRAADSWSRHRERALLTTLILKQIGSRLSPLDLIRYRGNVVEASRRAALLYPTNASLRASLAEASAEIGMTADAVKEGREALRLDGLTGHTDKKLNPNVRRWLVANLPRWEDAVAHPPPRPAPKPRAR